MRFELGAQSMEVISLSCYMEEVPILWLAGPGITVILCAYLGQCLSLLPLMSLTLPDGRIVGVQAHGDLYTHPLNSA